jgi:2-keto-4-pentenoate hydratase
MWGYVYNRTVHNLSEIGDTFSLVGLAEPRIEPEIVFRLAVAPTPGMDERTLLESIDWVAHVLKSCNRSLPNGSFPRPMRSRRSVCTAPRSLGLLIRSGRMPRSGAGRLSTFEIDLKRNGTVVDHGRATNVLGGPVSALRYLIDMLARDQVNPPLAAGEIVTTGTLTRALPVSVGETWTTELIGVALDGIGVRFA